MFRGWIVVAGAFVVMMTGFGVSYSFGTFFDALQQEFGALRGSVSLVFAISGFLYFLLGIVSGPLADRIGPRPVVLFGMVLVAAGVFLAGRATALWQIYLAYGAGIGVGVGFAYVPAVAAVQRWFVRRRGTASGIAVAGIGIGTLIGPPAAAWAIDAFGWRGAYSALALAALVLGAGGAFLIEGAPARRGLRPDGDRGPPPAAHAVAPGATLGEALRDRRFWWLYAATFTGCLGLFIPFVHLVPYALDHSIERGVAVWLIGLIGIGSTIGRFFLGGMADRLGRRQAFSLMFLGMGLSMPLWFFGTGPVMLGIFALVFGLSYGGFVALAPALIADYFGARDISGIIGWLYSSVAVGTLAGPSLAGLAYDLTASYAWPIILSGVFSGIAAAMVFRLPEPGRN